jgi:hypothetical protein
MIIKKVYISICSRRAPEWGMIIKIQQAMQYAAGFGITCTLSPRVGESLICRARQNSLIAFMDTDCDYLLTIDDDVETPEHAIVKLIQDNKDIVGGFYRLKQDDRAVTAVRIPGKPDFPEILKKKLLTPAVYVSTGMMLVKRRVIEAMTAAYPSLHYTQNRTGKPAWALYQPYIHHDEYLSEDWAFCQRAKDVGFEVWADGAVRCGHWGLIKYTFEE